MRKEKTNAEDAEFAENAEKSAGRPEAGVTKMGTGERYEEYIQRGGGAGGWEGDRV